jgi:hypothetical protein
MFFKYIDFDGAKKTLSEASLLFSSPLRFNDPFDMSVGSLTAYQLGEQSLQKIIHLEFNKYIESEREINLNGPNKSQKTCADLREIFNILPDQAKKKLSEKIKEENPQIDEGKINRLQAQVLELVKQELGKTGIFCASQTSDNILLWSHYADNHQGLVLGFEINKEDSIFNLFRPVNYSNTRPTLYKSPEDFIQKSLSQPKENVIRKYLDEITFTKETNWSYEKEIRISVADLIEDPNFEKTNLQNFKPSRLKKIFLGLNMAAEDKQTISQIIKRYYSGVEVYEMERDKFQYKLLKKRVSWL